MSYTFIWDFVRHIESPEQKNLSVKPMHATGPTGWINTLEAPSQICSIETVGKASAQMRLGMSRTGRECDFSTSGNKLQSYLVSVETKNGTIGIEKPYVQQFDFYNVSRKQG